MDKGGCCPIPSLYSDEGHETLAETLIAIKTLVVVVNVRLEYSTAVETSQDLVERVDTSTIAKLPESPVLFLPFPYYAVSSTS